MSSRIVTAFTALSMIMWPVQGSANINQDTGIAGSQESPNQCGILSLDQAGVQDTLRRSAEKLIHLYNQANQDRASKDDVKALQKFVGLTGKNIDGIYGKITQGATLDRAKALGVTVEQPKEQTHHTTIMAPTSKVERAFAILVGTESGGKQFGGGGSVAGSSKPTTSHAGAIGIAQVMPKTAPYAAKLAKLKWDERAYKYDAAYNYKLGLAYFKKQYKSFGSFNLAFAAYNAGPGAVRKALRKSSGTWLGRLPRETRNYVTKNMRALNKPHVNVTFQFAKTTQQKQKPILTLPKASEARPTLQFASAGSFTRPSDNAHSVDILGRRNYSNSFSTPVLNIGA